MVVSIIFVVVLAPIWIDPYTLGSLTGSAVSPGPGQAVVSPRPSSLGLPTAGPVVTDGPRIVAASDAFERTVTDGWGSADVGSAFSIVGPIADYEVSGGSGLMRVPEPGRHRAAFLPAVSAHEVDLSFAVRYDTPPVGGTLYVYGVLRRTSTGIAYRPKVFVTPDGSLYAHVGLQRRTGETSLGRPEYVRGLDGESPATIRTRMVATGSDPTTIRVRVWLDGEIEPDFWSFAAIDWAGNLQGAGSVGVAAYLGYRATNGPVSLAFEDLVVTTTDPSR